MENKEPITDTQNEIKTKQELFQNEISNQKLNNENQMKNNNENTSTEKSENQETESTHSEKEQLLEKTKELELKLSEVNDKYIRLMAEFDNFRKRARKEKEDLIKYTGEEIWKKILPVLDDFERAMKENQNTNDIETIKKGFELIYSKIKNIFTQNNLTALDCLHKAFNADRMEAIAKIPAPSEELKGKVVEEIEKAYQLNDKIIRFAKVIVAE